MNASVRRALLAVSCILGMSACGGGGGGGSNTVVANAPPEIVDPLYARQWHLKNTGQAHPVIGAAATPGEDINVEPVWATCAGGGSCRGEGVTIALVDDGLEIAHRDLQPNISTTLSHRVYSTSILPRNGNPTPSLPDADNAHGTQVAGVLASRDNNGLGGRGVAPRASLVGYNLLQAYTTGNMVDALTYQSASISVSNNSWGPPDGTGQLEDSEALWRDAINSGLANGRNGRGTIYVWPAGNGRRPGGYDDLSNYDGYANYRGVIAVGALNAQGRQAYYSEAGANIWISAPGGEYCLSELAITTTDLSGAGGENAGNAPLETSDADYTQCANGTSFATPIVSGVVALMLQANPALSWRDVRVILARTARKNDPTDASWTTNGANRPVHPAYGFGMVDAAAAVNAARSWTSLSTQRSRQGSETVNLPIPDNDSTGISRTININGSGISRIEWVDVTFSAANHASSGDLQVVLRAPSGKESVLAERHSCDGACTAYNGWRFGVARHLDEPADGAWQLVVKDLRAGSSGTFQSWQITIYGH